jgi:ATP-dependent Clp protease ATP-binding subunit ClpC
MAVAREEAEGLQHDFVGTEHVLLGLLREDDDLARGLRSFGVFLDLVRGMVARSASPGATVAGPGGVKLTRRAWKVLEMSVEEAGILGDDLVPSELLLVSIIDEARGVAVQVLNNLGVDLHRLRWVATTLIDGRGGDPQ